MEEMWLARDNSGSLYMFIGAKPNKYKCIWHNSMAIEILMIGSSIFPEVKWSDEEPTKVKLVIDK